MGTHQCLMGLKNIGIAVFNETIFVDISLCLMVLTLTSSSFKVCVLMTFICLIEVHTSGGVFILYSCSFAFLC